MFLLRRECRDGQGEVALALSEGSGLRDATGPVDLVGTRIGVVVRDGRTLRGDRVRGQVVAPRDVGSACDAVNTKRKYDISTGLAMGLTSSHSLDDSRCR